MREFWRKLARLITLFGEPHRLATITDGVAGWFPGPTAASRRPARPASLFPGGRWKHRTNSPQYHLHRDRDGPAFIEDRPYGRPIRSSPWPFDDLSSRRPHLRVRSTPHGRSGPLLRAPLAGTPARAHQRLPGLPQAPRRSATQAGRLLPRGAPGNAHRALPGQLVALRRVHGGLKDGSWSARRPQRAPLAAAGAGPRLGGFLNDDARAARRWLLTDPMARSQTGPRDR